MNDYNELIERLTVSAGDQECLYSDAKNAIEALQSRIGELCAARIAYASEFPLDAEGLPDTGSIHANIRAMKARVAELESRLEISPLHNVDGIMARDATIKLQDERIAELEAEREKQEPVAHEYQDRDGIWRGFINQQHYKNTVEDGSWPIRALYAAPPVTAPVRLTDDQADKVDEAIREALGDAYDCLRVWNAWSYGTMGPDDFSQVAEDSDRVAEIRNAAAVALGFKVDE